MALGANVRRLREARSLTQTQLAELAGMDQQALAALEKRDSRSSSFLAPLAKALGVSPNELLGLTAAGAEDSSIEQDEDQVSADKVIELLVLFKQSSPRGRDAILDAARAAAKSRAVSWIRRSNGHKS